MSLVTDGFSQWKNLVLPKVLADSLHKDALDKRHALENAEDERRERQEREREKDGEKDNDDDQKKKKDNDNMHLSPLTDKYDGDHLKVYDMQDVARKARDIDEITHDDRKRVKSILTTLADLGEYRRLKQIPKDWRSGLDTLEEKFPNFFHVLDYIREAAALSEVSSTPLVIELDNVLLEGMPGTGKSYFSQALSEFLDAGTVCIRMETSQTSANLVGSDSFWANSKCGSIFENIALSQIRSSDSYSYANPTYLLDEIDKIGGDERYSPEAAMLSLFEKSTAKLFTDLSIDLTVDASKINWICTCNDSKNISAPLLSRLRKFVVEQPTPSQAYEIAKNIVDATLLQYAFAGVDFSEAAISALCTLSPRKMRSEAKSAIGKVLYRQSGDLVLESDITVEADTRKRIGFLP